LGRLGAGVLHDNWHAAEREEPSRPRVASAPEKSRIAAVALSRLASYMRDVVAAPRRASKDCFGDAWACLRRGYLAGIQPCAARHAEAGDGGNGPSLWVV